MTVLLGLLKWLLGRIFGGDAQVKTDAALATERASQIERESDVLKTAAADRAAADAKRLRNDRHAGEVHADPDDPINADPDLHLRD